MKKNFLNIWLIASLMMLWAVPGQAASVKNQKLSAVLLSSAQALVDDGVYQEADQLLTQSMLADPANDAAFALKGHVQLLMDNPKEGRRLLDLALNIRPDNQQAVFLAGQASLSLKDFDDAEIRVERLQELCGACENHAALLAEIAAAKADTNTEDAVAENAPSQTEAKEDR